MKDKIKTYLLILPRWFALPAALTAIALGGLLAGGITWQVWVAMVAGAIIMVGGHAYNSFADHLYGLDRGTPASVSKWYTSGSQVIEAGLTTRRKVLIYWVSCYAIATALVAWIAVSVSSAWIWLPWAIAITTATVYSPGFCKGAKHIGFPEYCGIVGFGIGGTLLGYVASSGSISFVPVICGIAISLFWGLSWAPDQFPDAESDYRKGVRNLGTIIAITKFPMGAYYLPAMLFAYVFQVFVISIGYLSPMSFLSVLALPLFTLAAIWMTKGQDDPAGEEFEKGVRDAILGIFLAMGLFVVGQAIGG